MRETPIDADKREFFAGCFDRFYADVVRYARRRVDREAAGDVAAEVFRGLATYRRTYDDQQPPGVAVRGGTPDGGEHCSI